MEKDMIFFSAEGKGLTSTSANHVANLAKEMIRNLTSEMAELQFYSTDVALIGDSNTNRLVNGVDDEAVKGVLDKLFRIAKAKSLIAWLREGIKAKEALIEETENLSLEDFAKKEGIKLEEEPKPVAPLTEDEYIGTLSLKERCRYYEVETLAAVLGKEIHPGGSFAEARDSLLKKLERPHSVSGEGRDTLIYSYTASVDTQTVEDVYFRLQKLYREAQADVNTDKHACKKAVTETNIARNAEFVAKLNDWTNNRKLLDSKRMEYVKRHVRDLGEMKIVIPDSLKVIYEEVSRLGKAKDPQ